MNKSAGLVLWRVSNRWQRAQREALQPLGLTHVQVAVLESVVGLAHQGAEVKQKRLAEDVGADPMTISQVVRGLEQKGLLVRATHPSDRRAVSLSLTSKAKKLLDQARAISGQVDAKFFDAVDPESLVEALEAVG